MAHQASGIVGIAAGKCPRDMFAIFGRILTANDLASSRIDGNRALVHTDQEQ